MTSVKHVSVVSVSLPPRSFLNCRIVSQLHPSPISPYPRLKMCSLPQSRSHLNPIQALRFTFLLCLSWILPQSGSWYLHRAYIQVTSHLHPDPPNCILVPPKHHLKPIHVSRCVSHLHPGPFSTGELYLSSTLVPYHHIPSKDVHLTSIQVPPQPHPGSQIHVSSLSQLNLTSIWLMIFASRQHPGNISPPSRSIKLHLSSIQASSQTHTGLNMSPYPRLKMCISPQSRSHLNTIQALRFTFLRCLSWILPQSGSWYLHHAYIQVTSHLHPGPPNCILVPPKHHLKPIHVSRCVSHLHPGPFSTGELYLSSTLVPYHHILSKDVHLTSIQVPPQPHPGSQIFTFLLCLSWILPQSGSWYLHLANIQVTSHLHPGPSNCIFVPSKHHLKPIQVSRCHPIPVSASHLNPGPISTPSRLSDSRFFVVSVESYLNLAHDICISPTSRSTKLKAILVPRCVSHLHPGHFSTGE